MRLNEYLNAITSDELKRLGSQLLDMPSSVTRKDARIAYFEARLLDATELERLWQQMDDLSQKMVAAAYHNDGEIRANAFIAHYGSLPERPASTSWYRYTPILLDLFIWQGAIPDDMLPLLVDIVPPPQRFQLAGLMDAPTSWTYTYSWDGQTRTTGLVVVNTEEIGLTDLLSYLRLLELNELKFTTSGQLNARSVGKLMAVLINGDYFDSPEKLAIKDTLRPFGLATFVSQSGFGQYVYVSDAGRAFLRTRDPALLLDAFEQWAERGSFDELTRINAVKGLRSKNTRLTLPNTRRAAIVEALSWCPTNVWIDIDDFYRALKIWHFDFDVEDRHYYSNLGFGNNTGHYRGWYSDEDYWRAIKGLYINCVIWEYLATIGAVDIAYTQPADAYFPLDGDYSDEAYSRYDGLRYFRINKLGAFLLGQAHSYEPSVELGEALFRLTEIVEDANSLLRATLLVTQPDDVTPAVDMLLRLLAEPTEDEHRLQLHSERLLEAVGQGYSWQSILDFLDTYHQGPIPENVVRWLAQLQHNSTAFKGGGKAIFVKVRRSDLVALVTGDGELSRLATPIDRNTLIVAERNLTRFKKRLRQLGYLMAE